MSINLKPAFPFTSIEDERLYRYHKLFAESYVTNLRNLEAPWKPVIASVLEAVIKKSNKNSLLPPPPCTLCRFYRYRSHHDLKAQGDALSLRYLVDPDPDFRAVSRNDMGHKAVDYLVCAELKRSVKRLHIQQGLKDMGETRKSYKVLLTFLRHAAKQAARQAFVAMQRPEVANSDIILIAVSGPFWMWCLARRARLLGTFSMTVMQIMEEAEMEREEDKEVEEFNTVDLNDLEGDDGSYIPISTAPFNSISPEEVFDRYPALPWSNVVMLDTQESDNELRSIVKALLTVVEQK